MAENLICMSKTLVDPTEGAALAALQHYFYAPVDLTIVMVNAAPEVDDADLTLDINDDGVDTAVLALACNDASVPGTWKAVGYGGAANGDSPIKIAAGSLVTLDVNGAANGTALVVDIWALTGTFFS